MDASASRVVGPALALLVLNVTLQVLDGSATILGVGRGFPEGNPLLERAILLLGLPVAVVLAKGLAVALLTWLYRRRAHPWVVPGLAGLAVVYMTLAVVPWTIILATAIP